MSIPLLVMTLIRSQVWGLALLALCFSAATNSAAIWQTLGGAMIGAAGSLVLSRQKFCGNVFQGAASCVGIMLLLGNGVWRNWAAGFGPEWSQGIAWSIGVVGFALSMELCSKIAPAFRFLQALALLGACAQMWAPHRYGHLERPYWMVEPLLEAGIRPDDFLRALSGVLLVASFLILADLKSATAQLSAKRAVGLAVVACLFISGVCFVLPQPLSRPLPEPTPPHAPDAPPPPPPPSKLAVVRFEGFCSPTDYTDDAYLFYKKTASELLAPSEPPSDASAEQSPSSSGIVSVKTQVSLFSKETAVPNLIGSTSAVAASKFDTSRFQAAWEVQARFPRDAHGGPVWLEMPADRSLTKLEEALWQGIFQSPRIRANKAAARIKEELEKAGKLSEKAAISKEKWNLENFIFEDTTGGALNFANAASELLQIAGLESRIVSGFRYDPGKGGAFHFKEVILLTEAHSVDWVEWRAAGGDWRPLMIHPETVLDDKPQPPPEEDLENLLAKEQPPETAKKTQANLPGDQPEWDKVLWPLLLGFLMIVLLAYGSDLAWGNNPELTVFAWMILLLRGLGWRCERGEGWDTFARRLGVVRPEMAACFNKVRLAVENVKWELKAKPTSREELVLILIRFLCGLLRWPKHKTVTLSDSKATTL